MATLSGTCTDGGTPVSGAVITIIDSATDTVAGTVTSDGTGNWSFDVGNGTYHVVAEYDDGAGGTHNTRTYPFVEVTSDVVIVEDFEGVYPGNWADGSIETQSTVVLKGTTSARGTGVNGLAGNTADLTMNRDGTTYEMLIRQDVDVSAGATWLTHVQSATSPLNDCYMLRLNTVNDVGSVYARNAGASNFLGNVTVSGTLDLATTYKFQWIPTASDITFSILDETDTVLGTNTFGDTSVDGGGFGIFTDDAGTDGYYDHFTRQL